MRKIGNILLSAATCIGFAGPSARAGTAVDFDIGAVAAPDRGATFTNATEITYGWNDTNVLFNGAVANGQKIYGGLRVTGGTGLAINKFELNANGLQLTVPDASGGYEQSRMLMLWDDADFLTTDHEFDGTTNSSFSLTLTQALQQNGSERGFRFVVRDGETYYVANQLLGNSSIGSETTLSMAGDLAGLEWGAFDPTDFESMNIANANLNLGVTYSPMTFSNVTGVGFLGHLYRWQGSYMKAADFQVNLIGGAEVVLPPTFSVDRLINTPNDRLRVDYNIPGLDAGATVTMAVLDSGTNKLEFTAYDDRSANTVRSIYTTKNVSATEIADATDDFTLSGFFSSLTNINTAIPINDSMQAADVIDLTSLTNPASVYKVADEQVVYIDLASISGIDSGTNTLSVQLSASSVEGSPLTVSTNVMIVPAGSVIFSKASGEVTDPAAFEATQSILLGSGAGEDTTNRFTGGITHRHPVSGPAFNQDQTVEQNGDRAFGMYFDTDVVGEITLTDILIGMHNNGTTEVSRGPADTRVKLELWKINAPLSELSLTSASTTFPLADRELVFAGTGTIDPSMVGNNDVWKMDLLDMELDADTRYGFVVRVVDTRPAELYVNVDFYSFDDGNHLRMNGNGDAFPFFGTTTGQYGDSWDILFWLNGYGAGYQAWAVANSVGAMGDDDDLDGLNNLGEYALNGNPHDDTDQGSTALGHHGGQFYFAHAKLIDSDEVEYIVEVNDAGDLVYGNWTNTGITVTSGALDTGYIMATNSVPLESKGFFRYTIQEK